MKIYRFILASFFVASITISSAQDLRLTHKDHMVKNSWMVGLGYNSVDDSGSTFKELLNINDHWNGLAIPSRLSFGRYFENGLGVEAIGSYNKYKLGKIIGGETNTTEKHYWSLDARLSYDLNTLVGETGFFDPYVGAGVGYTRANGENIGTFNAVIGFRTWFSDQLGLDIGSSGKWGMGAANNHLQHHAGLVYRFGIEKGLSKTGLLKLALINKQKRVADSINATKRAEEEARLRADRLLIEKEQALLAAEEKAKREAENQRRAFIKQQLQEVGNVGFAFNSSWLSKEEKQRLDKLVLILKANPGLILKVNSHADARGTQEYNLWLTQRRMKNTMDYLVNEKGVDPSRLKGEAFGKKHLLNDCDGTKYCPEAKHRENRRSQFEIYLP